MACHDICNDLIRPICRALFVVKELCIHVDTADLHGLKYVRIDKCLPYAYYSQSAKTVTAAIFIKYHLLV